MQAAHSLRRRIALLGNALELGGQALYRALGTRDETLGAQPERPA